MMTNCTVHVHVRMHYACMTYTCFLVLRMRDKLITFSQKMAHQLFIGRLPLGCRSRDVEDIFFRYGKMTRCDVKQGL